MSYQVLARKWRPRNFQEMVGQAHVLRALINALDNDRLHHAYLFTGTRGVGKTTIARILAKSLNCEKGVGSQPCGECSACCEIDEGRFVDLIEVDAASRTRVDETRELLENVQYTPTRGRYKVYLIDEVHMFSNHSFNALLKTLEEPPPHVKFLLATTDPQKLPVTILSRCLQFNLKRLPLSEIRGYLAQIIEQEKIEADDSSLQELARAADGSMRDALSLLDQAIAFGGGKLVVSDVRAMLGTIERRHLHEMMKALAQKDAATVLSLISDLSEQAPDYESFLEEILSLLQRIAVAQVVPDAIDDSFQDAGEIEMLASMMPAEDVQLFYQIGLIGRRDLPLAPDPQGGLEMVLLRMLAFLPGTAGLRATVETNSEQRKQPAAVPESPSEKPQAKPVQSANSDWESIIETMNLKGMVRQLAENCSLAKRGKGHVQLSLDPAHSQLHNDKLERRLEQALTDFSGGPVKLEILREKLKDETPARRQARTAGERQDAAEKAIAGDEHIKAMQDAFNAEVRPESVRPRNEN